MRMQQLRPQTGKTRAYRYGPQRQVSAVAVAQATKALAPASKPVMHVLVLHVVVQAALEPLATLVEMPPVGTNAIAAGRVNDVTPVDVEIATALLV